MKAFFALFAVSALLFLSLGAFAAEIESVKFAETIDVGTTRLTLNNYGLMRYKVVIKALVAGLYLPADVAPQNMLQNVPRRLEIHYFWALKAKDITAAANELLARNLSAEDLKKFRPQIDELHGLYKDVKAGDRYQLTYLPGAGTQIALNGTPLGTVRGAEFSAAYFQIWFGAEPMDVALRDQLLQVRR